MKKTSAGIFLLLLVASIGIYYKIFSLYFFQDDFVWISLAKDMMDHWQLMFTSQISGFFMPVVHLYFAGMYQLFHLTPAWYYAANIGIHALNAFLLFSLVNTITKKQLLALMASVLFVTFRFPMEAIVWISAVTQLLSAFFLVSLGLSWIYYLRSKKIVYYFTTIGITILFLFTKELSVLTIPFLILLTLWSFIETGQKFDRATIRSLAIRCIPFVCLFIVYFMFQFGLQQEQSPLLAHGFYQIGWHAVPNLLSNFLLTFIPLVDIAHQHGTAWLILAFLTFVGTFGYSVWQFKKHHHILPLLAVVWIVLAFIPTSFFTWDPLISRYGYIPSIGTALFLAYVCTARLLWQRIIYVYIGVNILFIWHMINGYYVPIHTENKQFTEKVAAQIIHVPSSTHIGIYEITPHKSFILPEILHATFDREKKRVRVLKKDEPCPASFVCL